MPIEIQCPECSRKFRVAEKYAGKRAKCPNCQGVIEIPAGGAPASGEPGAAEAAPKRPARPQPQKAAQRPAPGKKPAPTQWYVQTEDGDQYGPVSKQELDEWVAENRIDASCQLLCEGWEQWKWAEDVYPQVGAASAEPAVEENPFAGIGEAAAARPPTVAVGPPEVPSVREPAGAVGEAPGATRNRRALAEVLHQLLGFLSIVGFAGGGVAVYLSVRTLIKTVPMLGDPVPWQIVVLFVIDPLALLGAAVLYIIASYFLWSFRQTLDVFLRRDQSRELDRAMVVHKQFWLFVYIATGIVAGVLLITIIVLETLLKMLSDLFSQMAM